MREISIQEQENEKERKRKSRKDYFPGFGFSTRTYNGLVRGNITTVSELLSKTEADLMRIYGFGKDSLKEVKGKLEERGLHLGQERNVQETETEEESAPKTPRKSVALLQKRCNIGIEICNEILKKIEEHKDKDLQPEHARYEAAKENYLKRENIFDPEECVPSVRTPKLEDRSEIYIDSDIGDLGISTGTFTALKKAEINKIYELILKNEEELRRIWRYWR